MKVNKEGLIQALSLNFNYPILKHNKFGKLLVLDSQTAYRFSLTTNSYYLNDKYGLRLFGKFITFNHRDYSLLPGLFQIDEHNKVLDKNLPSSLSKENSFIFEGNKKLIFIESKTSHSLIENYYKKIKEIGESPQDYLFNIVSPTGSNWEHYFEFMASEYFINKGLLSDIQLPWSYHGRPDFGIYKHDILNLLKDYGLIKNGALVLELSALRLFKKKYTGNNPLSDNLDYELSVGEVKTKQQSSQIIDYLKTGLPIKSYEFMPNKKTPEKVCGLININDKGLINVIEGPPSGYYDANKARNDKLWFDDYLKINLLGNLTLKEITQLIKTRTGDNYITLKSLIKLVKVLKLKEIVKLI